MRYLLVSLLLLICSLGVQAQHRIESKYDRFTDQTTVRIYFLQVSDDPGHAINMDAFYVYHGNGNTISAPQEIILRFSPDADELFVLFDKERRQYAREQHTFRVPFNDMERLLTAKWLEMRLGKDNLYLSNETIKALREFMPRKINP